MNTQVQTLHQGCGKGVTRGYKDGLQPETLADGNWLVKQNQPVSKVVVAKVLSLFNTTKDAAKYRPSPLVTAPVRMASGNELNKQLCRWLISNSQGRDTFLSRVLLTTQLHDLSEQRKRGIAAP